MLTDKYDLFFTPPAPAGEIAHLQPQARNENILGQTIASFQEQGSKSDRELLRHGFSSAYMQTFRCCDPLIATVFL